ncbi:DUF4241 domain-containing protein [Dactylosporangium aurantiacum]|uniref:DUF4241 domain-containing protein n=1 Tax=Dactylosporangium aurantiacum TaxID=35754 RepID=UPI001FE1A49C|nr:DUF4241 domain-containing protein [Dactylosporangium aurantiacum]MDG6107078.1 DUF4241 domain-containing protein [Dactylosporangium aurantiacum]
MPDLGLLLTAGHRAERDGTTYRVEPYDLGPVTLPTGRVVGCDPLVPRTTPFVDEVPPGRYLLRAWVAALGGDGGPQRRRADHRLRHRLPRGAARVARSSGHRWM